MAAGAQESHYQPDMVTTASSHNDYLAGLRERLRLMEQKKVLPEDQSQILLARRLQAGDAQAAKELVRVNRALIGFVSSDFAGKEIGSDSQLLIGAAKSVITAAQKFNPYKHGSFAEHAGTAVVASLVEALGVQVVDEPEEKDSDQQQVIALLRGMAPKHVKPGRQETAASDNEPLPANTTVQVPEAKPAPAKQTQSKPAAADWSPASSLDAYRSKAPTDTNSIQELAAEQRRGDPHARQEIIRRFLPIALGYARRHDLSQYDYDDLVQAGVVGIIQEVDRYDPARGGSLAPLIIQRMQGAMLDHIRKENSSVGVSRHRGAAEASGGSSESAPQQGGEADRPTSKRRVIFSLDDEDVKFVPADTTDIEEDVTERLGNYPQTKKVQAGLQKLRPDERQAVEERQGFGGEPVDTWRELGDRLGISESGALLKHKGSLEKLASAMEDEEINRLEDFSKRAELHINVKQAQIADKLTQLDNTPLNADEITTLLSCLPGWKYQTGIRNKVPYCSLIKEVAAVPEDFRVSVEPPRKYLGNHAGGKHHLVLFVQGDILPTDALDVLKLEMDLAAAQAE